jgi:choline dehydrogenase-like flavoprotein
LGKYLSDHLSISISEIRSDDIAKVIRDFSRTTTLDRSLLWPRMSIETIAKNGKSIRSFAHGSHFVFNDSTPIFYKFLRKIKRENYFFSKKKTGSFQLNFFFEKLNSIENSIELQSNTENEIAPIKIKFNIDYDEDDLQLEIAKNYFKSLKDIYSLTQNISNFLSKFDKIRKSDLRSSAHPSGTYRMSINSELGVVNTKSELWNDSRIRVLGAGVLPRASSTHPTLISMVLARLIH